MIVGPSTTLGDLEVKLAAFGLRVEMGPIRAATSYEIVLVDPAGIYGYARGSTLYEAIDSAFMEYAEKAGRRLQAELLAAADAERLSEAPARVTRHR